MGTRGTFGFRLDQEDKLTYNHFDSYPDGLGNDVVEFIRGVTDWDAVKEQVRALEDVSNRKPTLADVEACAEFTDLHVSKQSTEDWYCLLRQVQGDPAAILRVGRYLGGNGFINDSLFCEYGYIINLDEMTLELYEGFQEESHTKGRYATYVPEKDGSNSDKYYACALVGTFPLDNIPEDWIKQAFPSEDEEDQK